MFMIGMLNQQIYLKKYKRIRFVNKSSKVSRIKKIIMTSINARSNNNYWKLIKNNSNFYNINY